MTKAEAMKNIKNAIEASPRNGYTAELHLQIIKYADVLDSVTGKEFCEAVGLTLPFGTEFSKMRKIADRLVRAGLDVDRI